MVKPIFFITNKDYGWLSNFYPCFINFEGEFYPTVEHAYQAAKTLDLGLRSNIRSSSSPGIAKRRGRKIKPLREDWESVKLDTMRILLRKKFECPVLSKLLIETGDSPIYEDSNWDYFWGTGSAEATGTGLNWMGKILMEVREELLKRRIIEPSISNSI